MTPSSEIVREGLWTNNAVFGQLLSLCPLLAVTGTATNGFGMGLATTVVLVISGLLVSLLRTVITREVRIPVYVMIIATAVTLVDRGMNAWLHDLHGVLGLFIPLIVTNCIILGRAEAFASKQSAGAASLDGLMMGVGFTWVLMLVGAVREILGSGTLFNGAALLLGEPFAFLETTLFTNYDGMLLAILPPGGFLVVGFLMAGKRVIDQAAARRAAAARVPEGAEGGNA